MSGSGSGSEFERTPSKRLRQMLKDRDVKRDPAKLRKVQAELTHRKRIYR